MTRRVDPNLLCELRECGAVGAEKCIHCGNCTAICSLSNEDDRFPRHMVRMAQLGMKDELLGSRQLWLCFNCGDCSETCPQQAEPANLMAAARCYAISQYAPFKIGNLFFRKPLLGGVLAVSMVVAAGLLLCSKRQAMPTGALKLFDFIPYAWIHDLGLAAMVLVGVLSLATIFTMIARIAGVNALPPARPAHGGRTRWLRAFWDAVVVQSLGQTRYREDCKPSKPARVWYLSQWFVHAAAMWGFMGLLLATALDYVLEVVGVKATGTFVPLWYPVRLIGTLSGLLFMYGVSVLLYWRWRAGDKAHSLSLPSDWIFLALLWFSGTTGFIIEIALYLPGTPSWGYWMFILHVAVSMTLLLLLPFSKFAHALYRMVALYIHALKPLREEEATSELSR
jgi:quinone-modifying oxidoreductase, subunit QmoC